MSERRREFLKTLSSLPLIGGLFACGEAAPTAAPMRNYLAELGVKPIINGAGAYTMFTGSLMQREVIDVIAETSKHFVRLDELHDRVGEKIAALVGAEAAMVSSGCFGAMVCGTAACLTGTDPARIVQIPDLTGMKSEVITQKSHRFLYDHAVRDCGVKIVEIETLAEFEAAVSEKTAMLWFLNKRNPDGQIKHEQWVELGRKHGIPTMNDCAADLPPVENLTKYNKMGFDLVAFSGGKGICGPQSAGLLFGRKDLIRAARLNTYPNSDALGRGLKVNKEEMIGMWVALENYMKRDHEADWKEWERRVAVMAEKASAVSGVTTEPFIPPIANETPHLRIRWDQSAIALEPEAVKQKLRDGDPTIEVIPGEGYVTESVEIAAWMLQPGEAEIIGDRIAEILRAG
ncbi:MAG: aminotransferase class V-fold PLP-dependent enzyme [Acidobacteria bacterium]|nr:aminotransferase class V-fold PLP-dependent enzyme [Acidobacteriota bacterium]